MARQGKKPPQSVKGKPEKARRYAAKRASADVSHKIAKTQLVELIAGKAGLTRKQSDEVVSIMLEVIVSALKSGKKVNLPGLGTLSVKNTAARIGVRPGTSEKLQIPAGKKITFKASSNLKDKL